MTTTITDWADLDAVRNDLGGDYVLGNDLDSNTSGYSGIGDDFKPIGGAAFDGDGFTGTFDGDGYAIRDLVVDVSQANGAEDAGLFRGLGFGATITSLAVVGADIGSDPADAAGVLFAKAAGGTITDCIVGGTVAAPNAIDGAGGVGGFFQGDTIERTIAAVDVSAPDAGGFCADNSSATIRDCYAIGTAKGGFLDGASSTETRCFWDVDASGTSTTAGGAIGLSTSQLSGTGPLDSMADRGVDFVDDYTVGVNGENASADTYPRLRTLALGVQNSVLPDSVSSVADRVRGLSASAPDAAPPVDVTWADRSRPPGGFRIERSDESSPSVPGDFETIETVAAGVEATTDSAIIDSGDYTYVVAALRADGSVIERTGTDAVTLDPPLAALAATSADLDGPGVALSWTVNYPTLDAIEVYRTDGTSGAFPGDYAVVASLSGDATATNDTSVEADSDYAYRLTASADGVGESDPTAADTASLGSVGPFLVTILGTNSPVDSGEELSVDVEIENQGEFTGDVDVAALLTKQ